MEKPRYVFIGASAGGISAIAKILDILPATFKMPIVIVQHLRRDARLNLNLIFGEKRGDKICEATEKEVLREGFIYFAPADYHLLIERDSSFALTQDEPIHFSRPSIDVTFESAAAVYGKLACGILLTGANQDGAAGLVAIRQAGGVCMVQSPATAEFPMMPEAALAILKPDFVGELSSIAQELLRLEKEDRAKN